MSTLTVEGCGREVTRISVAEAESEERRLTLLGQREEQTLRARYQVIHIRL